MAKWQQSIAFAITFGVGGVVGCDSEDDGEDMIAGTETDASDETFGEDDGSPGPEDDGDDNGDDGDWKGAGTSTNGTDGEDGDDEDGGSESGDRGPGFRR